MKISENQRDKEWSKIVNEWYNLNNGRSFSLGHWLPSGYISYKITPINEVKELKKIIDNSADIYSNDHDVWANSNCITTQFTFDIMCVNKDIKYLRYIIKLYKQKIIDMYRSKGFTDIKVHIDCTNKDFEYLWLTDLFEETDENYRDYIKSLKRQLEFTKSNKLLKY